MRAHGTAFAAIRAGKFRRYYSAGLLAKVFNVRTLGLNVRDGWRTMAGVVDSVRILRRFRPDVVFLKGGYVTVPVGAACKLLRIPFVIHESDVGPGLANRLLGKWATKIAVGFPVKSYHDFDSNKLVYTGNPVRLEIAGAHRLEGLAHFRLTSKLPVVLVTGGSGGARQINEVVVAALPRILEFVQLIHVTGEREYERVKFEVRRLGKLHGIDHYRPRAFLTSDMGMAMAAADVVLARAGANTIAELAVLGKPTVLIPNYEMAGHQVQNARVLARQGAVRVLDGRTLTADKLVGELKRLMGDDEEQKRLAAAIGKLAKPDAADSLAKLILETGASREAVRTKTELSAVAGDDGEPDGRTDSGGTNDGGATL